ncbi:MAG: RluA family pseudouridine synthase [Gallionella sp.]|nr:RluA family pseudouridine synthase [Gallionella sp.]
MHHLPYQPPPQQEITPVFLDEYLLVVDKPAGLLAVPGRGADKQDSLSSRLQAAYPDALIVHRLDMATSGLMLFARGVAMQDKLSHLFREREVYKRYEARVAGRLEQDAGEVDLPLGRDWPNRPKQRVDMLEGKHTLTRYRLLDCDVASDSCRVTLEPVTGRTHQLRVHLAALGHPILGDALYGDEDRAPRLLLHASELRFIHPVTGERVECVSHAAF